MPPISEDCSSQGESEMGDEGDSNFEQLMVSMLEERDKLQESLRDTQDLLQSTISRLQDVEKEKNMMQTQLEKTVPPVSQPAQFIAFWIEILTNFDEFFALWKGFYDFDKRGRLNERTTHRKRRRNKWIESRTQQHPTSIRAFGITGFAAWKIASYDCGKAADAVIDQLGCVLRGWGA